MAERLLWPCSTCAVCGDRTYNKTRDGRHVICSSPCYAAHAKRVAAAEKAERETRIAQERHDERVAKVDQVAALGEER
jgi:hypothetical protein